MLLFDDVMFNDVKADNPTNGGAGVCRYTSIGVVTHIISNMSVLAQKNRLLFGVKEKFAHSAYFGTCNQV